MGLSIYSSPNPEAWQEYDDDGEPVAATGEKILQRSYSGFSLWRAAIAEAAGVGTTQEGFISPQPDLDYSRFEDENYYGEWDEEPEDALYLIYVHSDCDGMIPHKYLGRLADRLEEILPMLRHDEILYQTSARGVTERFITGIRTAYERGEGLVFL